MFSNVSPWKLKNCCGSEALAISLCRTERGSSPTANFGRIPAGYDASIPNNARPVVQGKRSRGGLDASATPE